MRAWAFSLATGIGLVLVAIGVASAGTAASSLYPGSAAKLIPTPAQAGYEEIDVLTSGPARASARYTTPGARSDSAMAATIRVFGTEAAARASFSSACPGCGPTKKVGRASWSARLRLDPGAPGGGARVTVVASCRNLRVDTTSRPSGSSKGVVPIRTRRFVDAVITRAIGLGMSSSCVGTSGITPSPETGSAFWTEADAETTVVERVRIPYCKVAPHDAECRQQEPLPVSQAQCRGQDEKSGTSTYSRFTCTLLVGGEARSARIVVLPTGPATFRWQAL